MTSANEDSIHLELARSINEAMKGLPVGLALEARAQEDGVAISLTVKDASGRLEDMKEWRLGDELRTAASTRTADHIEAFLAASAWWLGAQPIAQRSELWPDDIFVSTALADDRLRSFDDFVSALGDPARRGVYVAKAELADFFERKGLGAEADDEALRAVYALTPAGRASQGLPESVRAVRWLASHRWGQRALVAMMQSWANEPYDPLDVAWPDGPLVTHVLLTGAWRALDPMLTDANDPLRRDAIGAFDRLPEPSAPRDLDRAGFRGHA